MELTGIKHIRWEKDTQNSLDQFNSYIENNQNNDNNANFENNIDNNNIIEEPNNNNIIEEPSDNNNNSNSEGLTYKGFKVAGVIEIPKTKVKYNVLDDPSAKSNGSWYYYNIWTRA